MESKTSKRSRAVKTQKERKRQKIGGWERSYQPEKVLRPAGQFVGVDQLPWKGVSLPDRLEDAEGFLELEEIDEVEVVREGDKIQYRVGR